MSDWPVWKWVACALGGLLGTVVLLVAGPVFVVWLHGRLDPNLIASYGSTGDMFGASAALFSGLGFFAVAVVLWSDSTERRRDLTHRAQSRTPFLVPTVSGKGARITRATRHEAHADISLLLELAITNVTDDPAMNVVVTAEGCGSPNIPLSTAKMADSPFGTGESGTRTASVHLSCSDSVAEELLGQLAAGQPTLLLIRLEYDSINGTRWASEVKFSLAATSLTRDQFRAIQDGEESRFIQGGSALGGGGDAVTLNSDVVANTWKHAAK